MDKFEFYLIMSAEAPKDPERFQRGMTTAYVNGIEPIEYVEESILDENKNVVAMAIMVKCRERWKGAAKRFFRKAKFENLNQKYNGRPVFG